jgi:hypothetical protein
MGISLVAKSVSELRAICSVGSHWPPQVGNLACDHYCNYRESFCLLRRKAGLGLVKSGENPHQTWQNLSSALAFPKNGRCREGMKYAFNKVDSSIDGFEFIRMSGPF